MFSIHVPFGKPHYKFKLHKKHTGNVKHTLISISVGSQAGAVGIPTHAICEQYNIVISICIDETYRTEAHVFVPLHLDMNGFVLVLKLIVENHRARNPVFYT